MDGKQTFCFLDETCPSLWQLSTPLFKRATRTKHKARH
jgi:hypothetical protein